MGFGIWTPQYFIIPVASGVAIATLFGLFIWTCMAIADHSK